MFSLFKQAAIKEEITQPELTEEQLAGVAGGNYRWSHRYHRHHHWHHRHHSWSHSSSWRNSSRRGSNSGYYGSGHW